MKIGIVRHFKVDYKAKKLMSSKDFTEYVDGYDRAKVIENEVDLGNIKWNKCYCSDLERAIFTAKKIYKEKLEITPLLQEVRMYPCMESRFKIPSFLWSISSRIAWKMNGKSQIESEILTKKRAKEFLEKLDLKSEENILIVSHGFFLLTLIKELELRGFKGHTTKKMKNGYVYILELE